MRSLELTAYREPRGSGSEGGEGGGEGGEGGEAGEADRGGGGGAGGGFESVAGILRVGSLQRISRRVLPHSTHGKIDAADEG